MAPTVTGQSVFVLGQAANANWQLALYGLLLGAALAIGALLIALANRWRRRSTGDALTASDQLAQFRSLYEQGAISQEEFNRLRGLLGQQMRQALDVPAKPNADGAQPKEQRTFTPGGAPPMLTADDGQEDDVSNPPAGGPPAGQKLPPGDSHPEPQ